jgi:exopolyphosphatase/pppGpp-phosphohydrolase
LEDSVLVSARKCLIGLKKKKADVILFDAAIYEASLREPGFPEMRVSTRGLRHAALLP